VNSATEGILPAGFDVPSLARLGLAMRRHRSVIVLIQWAVALSYLGLVAVPAFLPLPLENAHIWNNLTRFAQFVIWGIWWPFVIASIMAFGRLWCGVLCPEGALTEWVSRSGLGRGVPRWLKWGGWPFVAFVMTTVFGQMTSVYEYPKPALLILGGSTMGAITIGLLYGRGKRVWCRHLCPVSGMFALLAKIAPVHFKVNQAAWDTAPVGHRTSRQHPVNCAPLINIRRMESASACHMCGRCAGERSAVQLTLRSPGAEILKEPTPISQGKADDTDRWPARLLIFGMLGVALGAFQWRSSPWVVAAKHAMTTWLVEHEILWPLSQPGHWWLLTSYPEVNDAFTWLDGGMLLGYIAIEALVVGGWIWGWMRLISAFIELPWQRPTYVLIPFAGASVFVGLSFLTTSHFAEEGVLLPWAGVVRTVLLTLAVFWSAALAWRLAPRRRVAATFGTLMAVALPFAAWAVELFGW